MPCAKFTMMGFTTNLVLTPNCLATCRVMNKLVILESKRQNLNLLFSLHCKFNKLEASLLWALISTIKPPWRILLPWKCNHLPKVSWGNLPPNVHDCQSWSTWPLRDLTLPSYVLAPCLANFPLYCHEALACFGPTFVRFDLYSHYSSRHFVSKWPCFQFHPSGMEGLHPPCIPSSSWNFEKYPKCLLVGRLFFEPKALIHTWRPIS